VSLLDTSTNKQLLQKLKSKKFNDWVVLAFWGYSLAATTATFRIWSFDKKNTYMKYVPSHFLSLTIELHLVRFGSGASFTFELHCSWPSTLLLLLLFRFTKKICYFASSGLT